MSKAPIKRTPQSHRLIHNPVPLELPWTWLKSTSRCWSTCSLLLGPAANGSHNPPYIRLYVLLTFEHTVPAAWNKCPKPSSPVGAPPLILYHPDYVSFSCMQSFNKYVLACQAQDAYGNWKQTHPLLLMELMVTPLWSHPTCKFLPLLCTHKHTHARMCV